MITAVGKANWFPVRGPRGVQPVIFLRRGVGPKDVDDWIVDILRVRGNRRVINLKTEAESKVVVVIVHFLGQEIA